MQLQINTLTSLYWRGLLLCLCSLLNACSDGNQKITLSSDSVIIAFGDSLTQGVGAAPDDSYPSVLSRELGLQVINEGVSGETSAQGLARLEAILRSTPPDLVILCHGGNDLLRKLPMTALEQNLEQMIALIESYQAQVLLVAVPKPAIFLTPSPLYQTLAKRHQLVADLDTLTELLKEPAMKSDAVHLNALGYQALALAIADRITID